MRLPKSSRCFAGFTPALMAASTKHQPDASYATPAKPAGSSLCIQHTEAAWPYQTLDALSPAVKSSSSFAARGFW